MKCRISDARGLNIISIIFVQYLCGAAHGFNYNSWRNRAHHIIVYRKTNSSESQRQTHNNDTSHTDDIYIYTLLHRVFSHIRNTPSRCCASFRHARMLNYIFFLYATLTYSVLRQCISIALNLTYVYL